MNFGSVQQWIYRVLQNLCNINKDSLRLCKLSVPCKERSNLTFIVDVTKILQNPVPVVLA